MAQLYDYKITVVHNANDSEGIIRLGAYIKGDTGNGIASIIRILTEGNVDTYAIIFTDGSITTFKVMNGDGSGDMRQYVYDPEYIVSKHPEGIPGYVAEHFVQEFGDSDDLGICQRVLTEAKEHLQAQINAIVSDKATVSLTASPSVVFVNEECNISLIASSDTEATSIKIKKGTTEIAVGTGKALSGSDTVTPSAVGSISYSAEFTIAGVTKTVTKSVSVVKPILYGAGAAYTDATHKATARTSPASTTPYSITVATADSYVWFLVPNTMTIKGATMSGFDFPLEDPTTVDDYKIYRSSNTLDAGTYQIVIY